MTARPFRPPAIIDEEAAWHLILAARRAARSRELPEGTAALGFGPGGGAADVDRARLQENQLETDEPWRRDPCAALTLPGAPAQAAESAVSGVTGSGES